MKRLADQPFALLGINTDGDAATVKKILADQAITWRQAIDGDTNGPLNTQWNINGGHGWPAIFVLDAKGVIRYRDVRDDEMEKVVLALLEEARAGK